jgi:hypothetical protein
MPTEVPLDVEHSSSVSRNLFSSVDVFAPARVGDVSVDLPTRGCLRDSPTAPSSRSGDSHGRLPVVSLTCGCSLASAAENSLRATAGTPNGGISPVQRGGLNSTVAAFDFSWAVRVLSSAMVRCASRRVTLPGSPLRTFRSRSRIVVSVVYFCSRGAKADLSFGSVLAECSGEVSRVRYASLQLFEPLPYRHSQTRHRQRPCLRFVNEACLSRTA